ncbi:heavy metal-responsive transcriptional regulator [Ferrimicrobium sp.]|uniref:heavy metal-responsive transcriptional regulator n=1 Tax=Ferrimicrobium sp. TaxID=2926050 RepID=UPI0026033981|nr:heavy metal-responsive transcriptional regulator [Ferrimicrobium sp.]
MRIGEISRATQVSVKTLRYYETIGVLSAPLRTPEGYRNYSSDSIDQVRFVKASQSVGLALKEIKEIMAYREAGIVPCQHVLTLLEQRAAEYQNKIDELTQARATLDQLIERAQNLDAQDCLPGNVCHLIPPLLSGTTTDPAAPITGSSREVSSRTIGHRTRSTRTHQ